MNLRCIYCQTPFTLSRVEMLGAIVHMNEKNQNHYDAHCPRCRRANSISRQRMELFFPNWKEAAKQQASAAPVEPSAPQVTSATAMMKTEPLTRAKRAEAGKAAAKSAAKKATTAKGAAKKPAAKTSAAKPAAKKAPAKDKKK